MISDTALDEAAALIRDISRTIVLPRWRNLGGEDVSTKRGQEVVTIADLESERALKAGLTKLLPGSAFVGEESVEAEPDLVNAFMSDRPVWVVDPVDGTKNFAEGSPRFCVMAALWQKGETLAAFIDLTAEGGLAVARRGGGAYLEGEKLKTRALPQAPMIECAMHFQFLPKRLSSVIEPEATKLGPNTAYYCAGLTYTDLARGRLDCALYWRTKSWDHLAGQLLLAEAGGKTRRFDGTQYDPRNDGRGLFATGDQAGFEILLERVLVNVAPADRTGVPE